MGSNRDESTMRRRASLPVVREAGGLLLLTPIDQEKGGSWVGLRQDGESRILLNGAFGRHERLPNYTKSRGLVLLESFQYDGLETFHERSHLAGIEPFTIVALRGDRVAEMRWDGESSRFSLFDPEKPAHWSSATLYEPALQGVLDSKFKAWLDQTRSASVRSLAAFMDHQSYGSRMQRAGQTPLPTLQTISASITVVQQDFAEFHYFDHLIPVSSVARIGRKPHQSTSSSGKVD